MVSFGAHDGRPICNADELRSRLLLLWGKAKEASALTEEVPGGPARTCGARMAMWLRAFQRAEEPVRSTVHGRPPAPETWHEQSCSALRLVENLALLEL